MFIVFVKTEKQEVREWTSIWLICMYLFSLHLSNKIKWIKIPKRNKERAAGLTWREGCVLGFSAEGKETCLGRVMKRACYSASQGLECKGERAKWREFCKAQIFQTLAPWMVQFRQVMGHLLILTMLLLARTSLCVYLCSPLHLPMRSVSSCHLSRFPKGLFLISHHSKIHGFSS